MSELLKGIQVFQGITKILSDASGKRMINKHKGQFVRVILADKQIILGRFSGISGDSKWFEIKDKEKCIVTKTDSITRFEFYEKNDDSFASRPKHNLLLTLPAIDISHTNYFVDLKDWISKPACKGDNPRSSGYPIEGKVTPCEPNLWIDVSILTNRWWYQGKSPIKEDGRFNHIIYLDQSLPPATFRFWIKKENSVVTQIDALFE
jgi:hypothetical protein